VFSFGENDIFDQVANPQGSLLRHFQKEFRKRIGWAPPIISGRGIFNYDYGILPHRRKIVTVVGRPIEVDKIENPTMEEISAIQQKYICELKYIFDKYKDVYAENRTTDLKIVE
jgi:2-acylglycerol O-acyltransferase 2